MPIDDVSARNHLLQVVGTSAGERDEIDITRQVRRLALAIENAMGKFALIFGICNSRHMRRYISGQLRENIREFHPVDFELSGDEPSLLDALLKAPGGSAPLIVYGLEFLLPSSEHQSTRRDRTLREFQLRREQFRQLGRPLLLWMPEYAYTMIGRKAVDFWSWQSGGYFFPDNLPEVEVARGVRIGGDVTGSAVVTGRVVVSRFTAGSTGTGGAPPPKEKTATSRFRLSNLPTAIPDFTGRENEVSRLKDLLLSPDVRAVIITGMAGVGKTALAVQVAHRISDEFPDGTFLVPFNGSTHDPSTTAMATVISALGSVARISENDVTLRAIYRSFLSGKRVLLIFDGAGDQANLASLLPEPPAKAIITSRRRFVMSGVEVLSLDALTASEARVLLENMLGPGRASSEEINKLATLCGHLPLALRLAAGVLNALGHAQVADFIRTLASERERFEQRDYEHGNVAATLRLNIEQLRQEDAELEKRWRMLVVFPEDFDALAASAVWDTNRTDKDTSVSDGNKLDYLAKRGLVSFDEIGERYRLHELIRDAGERQLSKEECEQASERHARYFWTVLRLSEEGYTQGGESVVDGLELFDRERANIEAGWRWVVQRAQQSATMAKLCSDYADAGVQVLSLRHHPRERIRWLEPAAAAARRAGDVQAEGRHLANLGAAYAGLGEVHRATEYYQQALMIAREIGDRRGESNSLANLGAAYAGLGEVHRATEYYQQALMIAREIGDRRGESNSLANLGAAYAGLGEVHRATEYYQQALMIAREIGDRRGESNSLANLGAAYAGLGEVHRATEYYQQALMIAREIGDRRGESNSLANLGDVSRRMGDASRATEYYQQALMIAQAENNRLEEAVILGRLGVVYADLGESKRAVIYLKEALAIDEKYLGPNHPRIATDISNLGLALHEQGDFSAARDAFERALFIDEKVFGPDHPNVAIRVNNLGSVLADTGDLAGAQAAYERALWIYEHVLGSDHPNTRTVRANLYHQLGRVAQAQRRWAEAEGYYQQALATKVAFDDRHAQASTYHQLGRVAEEQRRWAEAEGYYQQALAIFVEFNARHAQASTYHQLGRVAEEQRRWAEAEGYYQQALAIFVAFNDRYSQALTYHQLGVVAQEQRRWAEAEGYYKQALAIKVEFNARYEQASTYHHLGMVAQEQRRWAEAEGYYKQALAIKVEFNARYEQASTYHHLGRVAQEQRRWAEAEGYYRNDLEISKEFEDWHGVGITISSIARLWRESGAATVSAMVADVLNVSIAEAEQLLKKVLDGGETPNAES